MSKFAKLFETDLGQILVLLDTDEHYNPQLSVMFKPESLGVCKVNLSWKDDSDESWDGAEEALDLMTEDKVYAIVKSALKDLKLSED